ncbi:MAG: DUF1036 domain-containing protein [Alphaproteobacteria bacterium]|nr:DUF1036 domain-containing protein [Alphaproteobacteria bacterium]
MRLGIVVILVGWIVLASGTAQAAFLFCNQTQAVIEAAFAYREDDDGWISEGWWQLQPGQCARVYNKHLSQRFYFYYARALGVSADDGSQPKSWSGRNYFCIGRKAFKVDGDTACEQRGYQKQGFQEVDVGIGNKDYTLTFRNDR